MTHGLERQLAGVRVLSRGDAAALVMVAVAIAAITLVSTITDIVGKFTGPVSMRLPLDPSRQGAVDLESGATGRFSELQVTLPSVPGYEASLLVWAAALNQVCVLCVVALLILLAYRLTSEKLFAPGLAALVGVVGTILAISGSFAQVLDSTARNRLAEQLGALPRTPGDTIVYLVDFSFVPLAAGVVLVLLAGVFQFGRRLQRDTDGLI